MCAPLALAALPALFASGGTALAGSMTAMQMISLAASAGSAVMGAKAAYDQSKFSKGMAKYNAGVADNQAADALNRGEKESQRARAQARQLVSAQRSGYSARGIDIGEGTAADVIDQTNFFGEVDAGTARTNSRREAAGYQARSTGYSLQADAENPGMAAAGSLLSSASSVADKWYRYKG